MSATLRADDPRAREIAGMGMMITPLLPSDPDKKPIMRATLHVVWADGRPWSGSCDGRTCHEAATGCMALAREEGVE